MKNHREHRGHRESAKLCGNFIITSVIYTLMTEETIPENLTPKDATLENLRKCLRACLKCKTAIRDLINKRKVELGLMKSGLPQAGYRLRKRRKKPRQKASKETVKSLNKIARVWVRSGAG